MRATLRTVRLAVMASVMLGGNLIAQVSVAQVNPSTGPMPAPGTNPASPTSPPTAPPTAGSNDPHGSNSPGRAGSNDPHARSQSGTMNPDAKKNPGLTPSSPGPMGK